jgi:hypothetical protein
VREGVSTGVLSCSATTTKRDELSSRRPERKKSENAPNSRIHRTGDDLRVAILALDVRDRTGVTSEDVNLGLCSHVPNLRECEKSSSGSGRRGRGRGGTYTSGGITTGSDKDVESGVKAGGKKG